jgi:hypothetical protein
MQIVELCDWQEKFKTGSIENEYGEAISPEDMVEIITKRGHPNELRYASEDGHSYYTSYRGKGTYTLHSHEFC